MRINAISNQNYTQNNSKQNFKGLYFKEKTLQTIGKNLNFEQIRTMNAAAGDVINLEALLCRNVSEPIFENLLLKLGAHANNLNLLYEPLIDKRYTTMDTCGPFGSGEMKVPYYYALGGEFEILGYVPPRPRYSDNDIAIAGFKTKSGEEIPSLKLRFDFDTYDTSHFKVYTESNAQHESVKKMKRNLEAHGFIPNEACPIPTKEFIQKIVKTVYNYLLDENTAKMTDVEIAELAEETKALRQKYAAEQLGNFIYSL